MTPRASKSKQTETDSTSQKPTKSKAFSSLLPNKVIPVMDRTRQTLQQHNEQDNPRKNPRNCGNFYVDCPDCGDFYMDCPVRCVIAVFGGSCPQDYTNNTNNTRTPATEQSVVKTTGRMGKDSYKISQSITYLPVKVCLNSLVRKMKMTPAKWQKKKKKKNPLRNGCQYRCYN